MTANNASTVMAAEKYDPSRINRFVIDLWTHDSDGITQKDVDLAGKLEALAQRMS